MDVVSCIYQKYVILPLYTCNPFIRTPVDSELTVFALGTTKKCLYILFSEVLVPKELEF